MSERQRRGRDESRSRDGGAAETRAEPIDEAEAEAKTGRIPCDEREQARAGTAGTECAQQPVAAQQPSVRGDDRHAH